MMNLSGSALLADVFSQVLQEYAFLFADPIEKVSNSKCDGPFFLAAVSFTGRLRGTLSMAAPSAFACEVSAGVLGLESDSTEAQIGAADAIKEFLNVICGNLLSLMADRDSIFDLALPEFSEIPVAQWLAALSNSSAIFFLVEDWPVFLEISFSKPQER